MTTFIYIYIYLVFYLKTFTELAKTNGLTFTPVNWFGGGGAEQGIGSWDGVRFSAIWIGK